MVPPAPLRRQPAICESAAPDPETRERVALRVIAVSFFALAACVTVDAVLALAGLRDPQHSPVGIALTAVSLLVTPAFSLPERRTGTELGSTSASADSEQTLICAALSAVVLIGLLLDALLDRVWADPAAGIVLVAFAVREGLEAWGGDACSVPVAQLAGERPECDAGCC